MSRYLIGTSSSMEGRLLVQVLLAGAEAQEKGERGAGDSRVSPLPFDITDAQMGPTRPGLASGSFLRWPGRHVRLGFRQDLMGF